MSHENRHDFSSRFAKKLFGGRKAGVKQKILKKAVLAAGFVMMLLLEHRWVE